MSAGIQADVGNAGALLPHPGRPVFWRAGAGESRLLPVALILVLAAGFAGCRNRKATAAPSSPPPPAVVTGPIAPPPELISEPQTTTKIPEAEPIPANAAPEPLGPLAGRDLPGTPATEPPPQPQRPVQATASDDRPAPDGTEVSPPVPRLGQILTSEERQAYHRTIDNSIEAARRNLAVILNHTLRPDQMEAVRRIRAFINQAETARERDLTLAKNLADRALLLAEDLARSFR